jgi:hypothetical protein
MEGVRMMVMSEQKWGKRPAAAAAGELSGGEVGVVATTQLLLPECCGVGADDAEAWCCLRSCYYLLSCGDVETAQRWCCSVVADRVRSGDVLNVADDGSIGGVQQLLQVVAYGDGNENVRDTEAAYSAMVVFGVVMN